MKEHSSDEENGSVVKSGLEAFPNANRLVTERLQQRLKSTSDYSADEILCVTNRDTSLFAQGFELDSDQSETFRALVKYSQCTLLPKPPTSHRKIIGPFIVAAKRLVWRFVKPCIEDAFNGLQEFCTRAVYNQARQTVEIESIKKLLQNKVPTPGSGETDSAQ